MLEAMPVAGRAAVGNTGTMRQHIRHADRSPLGGSQENSHLGESSGELVIGWPAILACFCLAIFAWGFGFYGQSVYLAALRATRGWSTTLISGSTTTYYLWGALLLALVPGAIDRFGVRGVAMSGALLLGAGTVSLSNVIVPWQLYTSALVMGVGGRARRALPSQSFWHNGSTGGAAWRSAWR